MDLQHAIAAVAEGRDLDAAQMTSVMNTIMHGEATPAQIGGFLVGLRMKGETVDEITAAVEVMRALSTKVPVDAAHLVDTCGTGGDASGTFNISTASALVVAAAGGKVAKHGNRSVSSRSGSADVLEAAGVNLDLTPEQVAECIATVGVGFLFAPRHHGAMRHAIGPRREMGVRTIFNLLGPLTNPASAPNQVLGVFSDQWLEPFAEVLMRLGSHHVLVVHAQDGLDEISIGSVTQVAELRDGAVRRFTVSPEDFSLERAPLDAIKVRSAQESLTMLRDALGGKAGPAMDVIALNAGAAIYTAGLEHSLGGGVKRATGVLSNGAALGTLDRLVEKTRSFALPPAGAQ
ncbi:MAG: anthranilate phosphoribosyltransferase [Pseudomonadota bacterium]|nr:anthranilate phosphoribosyltransferase [Pseudomonadota bacterium]